MAMRRGSEDSQPTPRSLHPATARHKQTSRRRSDTLAFSPEFRDEAVKLVIEGSRPIAEVARELGIDEGTLGNWVNQYRPDDGLAPARSAHRADRAPWMAGTTTFAGIMLIIALDLFVIRALTALKPRSADELRGGSGV